MDKLKAKLLDISPVIIVLLDVEQNIIWANKAYQHFSGFSLQACEGKKCYEVWNLAKPCMGCPVPLTILHEDEQEAKVPIPGNRNQVYGVDSLLVKSSPIKESDGSITGIVVTVFKVPGHTAQLQRYEKTMASLMKLVKDSGEATSSQLLQMFLDEAEYLTESKIGFYHFVEEDQKTLSLQMWSSNTTKHCTASGAGTHYLIEQAGVWVDCVRERESVVHNDYMSLPHKKGLPEGHVPIVRDLVVPVMRGGKLMSILGVGNKATNYDADDVWILEQLAAMAWESIVRKRTEEENKVLQEQFMQAQKMESIGRLAGGVAHDFNNMLSIIAGYAELSLDKLSPDDSLHSDLQEILSAANRSAEITRQLLAFARQQTISPIILNLNDAVQSMLKMLRRLLGENIDLEWKPSAELWQVKLDPVQIDQLLANLCVNSRDAIADVGKITIETGNVVIDEAFLADHTDIVIGEYVLLTISDNGCGMDKEMCKYIFEPFYTTKKEGKGTGLGLATVYGIVKQNGGFIHVYSEPGQGTIFRIYLARHQEDAISLPKATKEEILQGNGETILIVEDEVALLKLTRKVLEKLGYEVLTSATPKEALQLAAENGQNIDLLLTDVIMPEMNGKVLSERLVHLIPNMKCLYMSGYTANAIAHHGILEEGVNFITKPVSQKDLGRKVREVLDSS